MFEVPPWFTCRAVAPPWPPHGPPVAPRERLFSLPSAHRDADRSQTSPETHQIHVGPDLAGRLARRPFGSFERLMDAAAFLRRLQRVWDIRPVSYFTVWEVELEP